MRALHRGRSNRPLSRLVDAATVRALSELALSIIPTSFSERTAARCLHEIIGEERRFNCNERGAVVPVEAVQRAVLEMESTEAHMPALWPGERHRGVSRRYPPSCAGTAAEASASDPIQDVVATLCSAAGQLTKCSPDRVSVATGFREGNSRAARRTSAIYMEQGKSGAMGRFALGNPGMLRSQGTKGRPGLTWRKPRAQKIRGVVSRPLLLRAAPKRTGSGDLSYALASRTTVV